MIRRALLFISSLMFLLLAVQALGFSNDSVLLYSCYNGTFNDGSGYGYNLVAMNGALANATGKYGSACYTDGSNDYIMAPNVSALEFDRDQAFSIFLWFKTSSCTASDAGENRFLQDQVVGGNNQGWFIQTYNNGGGTQYTNALMNYAASSKSASTPSSYCNGAWNYIGITNNASNYNLSLYVNGSVVASSTSTISGSIAQNNNNITLGRRGNGYGNNYYERVVIFNRTLSATEVASLFADNGSITYPAPSVPNTTYTFNTNDLFDLGALSGVTIVTTIGNCTTSAGSCVLSTSNHGLGTINYNASKSLYSTLSGSVAANSSAVINMTQGSYNITSITEIITGLTLGPSLGTWSALVSGGRTYSGGGTTYPQNIHIRNGTNNLTLTYTGSGVFYPKTFQLNISAPQSGSVSVANVSSALLNITARNVLSNTSVGSFNVTVSNNTYSVVAETTNGTVLLPLANNLGYSLFMNATDYALANASLIVASSTPSYRFDLYTQNSVNVNIYDENTGLPITQNITIIIGGDTYSSINTTTTSNFYIDGLLDGDYIFRFSGTNYTLKSYTVTVGNRSTQTLNAYLSASNDQTIFTYQDEDSGVTLEGVGATMYRLVNSSWQVVESKTSDITGRVQYTYTLGVKYKFVSTISGYEDKVFYLDPILFTTYTVKMKRTNSLSDAPQDTGVEIIYSPKSFSANQTGNFTFLITSPSGTLISYGVTIAFPSANEYYQGDNANGGEFVVPYDLSGATGDDEVVVYYYYNSTIAGYREFEDFYHVKGLYGTNSIERLKENTFGLGVFERVLVAITMTGIIAGVAAMIGGLIVGGSLGLLFLGFFVYINFIPIWAAAISLIVGFILISKKGGE